MKPARTSRILQAMYRKTGLVKDNRFLLHGNDWTHPESPARLKAVYKMLDAPDMKGCFFEIPPRDASQEMLERVHRRSYIDQIARTKGRIRVSLDPDTDATEDTYVVARLAAGSLCHAIDHVMDGRLDNAFALVRPPGHHAEADAAAGFCIFNNIAIGARHALVQCGARRILIVDWDVHHGNGTQHSFYDDNQVLYFSVHQFPFYPGTGHFRETGHGPGAGYTINCPLTFGADDGLYVRIFRTLLVPVTRQFKPELILVSAGFDTHEDDPLGSMRMTSRGYAALTRILMNEADSCCKGRMVFSLEGGYHLPALAESVRAVLKELRDDTRVSQEELDEIEQSTRVSTFTELDRVLDQVRPFWKGL